MTISAHFSRVVQDQQGNVLVGATVSVCNPGTDTVIGDELFSDAALSQPLTNPFTLAGAVLDFYLAAPKTVRIKVSYGSFSSTIDIADVLPPAENLLTSSSAVTISNEPGVGRVLGALSGQELAWVDPPLFGGNTFRRTTGTTVTASLAPGQSDSATVMPLAPGYRLYQIQTSGPARVRLYESAAARTADLARPIGTDPASNTGVVLDYVTSSNAIYNLSPLVDGANLDASAGPDIPMSVTNLDVTTETVTVTITYLPTETIQ